MSSSVSPVGAASKVMAPMATPMPARPEGEHFTEAQWRTLLSIMDAIVPKVVRESVSSDLLNEETILDSNYNAAILHLKEKVVNAPDGELLDKYLQERPSDNPEFHDLLMLALVEYSREDARKGLSGLCGALNTRVGCFLLTGTTTPFHELSVQDRAKVLIGWRSSRLASLRAAFKQLTLVAKSTWLKTSPTFPSVSGFPKVPDHYKAGPTYEYNFLQFNAGAEPEIIETDVVIVGSGCGGGVCAKNLAEDGHKVTIVDRGYYFPPAQLPMGEKEAGHNLYIDGGVISADDGSISVIAGQSWGGGGTVNWSASLQPQNFVRDEWAKDRGMPFFNSPEFQASLDRVCARMGVSTNHIRHNHGNEVLLEGARRIGMTSKAVPQNTGGDEHFCGHCTLGCGSGQKQGPVVSWLPDAAKAGARFVEGFAVDRVIFETIAGIKTAVGVVGTWTSRNGSGGVDGPDSNKTKREVIVRAKKVIISCGTLYSPVVLLKSGLRNPQIGKNLYLHPVNIVSAVYAEDVRPWEGGILTSVVSTLENLDHHGHGVKLEATTMMPSWCLPFMNWENGLDFKLRALKYRHMNGYIAITRDRDTGRVYPDPISGSPRVDYTPSKFDRAHCLKGVLALARINYVMRATEIDVSFMGTPGFVCGSDRSDSMNKRFEEWLAMVEKTGNQPPSALFASAHQMGTCRMADRESRGVVSGKNGEQGKVFGVEGLYVADASVFPSASGVNPMVTNMGISDWISRGVSKTLKQEAAGITEAARLSVITVPAESQPRLVSSLISLFDSTSFAKFCTSLSTGTKGSGGSNSTSLATVVTALGLVVAAVLWRLLSVGYALV